MRPGVPWSVKGIDDQARTVAKSAARDAGLTLGQWLNTLILESSDEPAPAAKPAKKRAQKTAEVKVDPKAGAVDTSEIKDRLDQLADQLSNLTQTSQDTAVARFMEPAEETAADAGALEAIIDRIEANERRAEAAFGQVNDRLQDVSERLENFPTNSGPTSPEDVPGFTALEAALRNIVEHVGQSERRTVETLANIQERMSDIAARANRAEERGIESSAAALNTIEERITHLADRIEQGKEESVDEVRTFLDASLSQLSQRIDDIHRSAEVSSEQARSTAAQLVEQQGQQIEGRLNQIIEESRKAQADDPQLGPHQSGNRQPQPALR